MMKRLRILSVGTFLLANNLTLFAQDFEADSSKAPNNPNIIKQILLNGKHVFTSPLRFKTQDWLLLGAVIATTGAIGLADGDLRESIQNNRNGTTRRIARVVGPLGDGRTALVVAGGFYLIGSLTKNEKSKETIIMAVEAGVVSGMFTGLIKLSTARGRPFLNDGPAGFGDPFDLERGQTALPSGHTTLAFSSASVISSQYDSPWVAVTAYSLASLVGWSRIHDDKHWASDVFLGAVIGTVVGRTVVKLHNKNNSGNFKVSPMFNSNIKGIGVSRDF